MITQARVDLEKKILDRYFPRRYAFVQLGTQDAYLDVGLKSNTDTTYRLKILLNSFPNSVPKMFITYPSSLCDYNGKKLVDFGVSSEMHLLGPKNGHAQVCHYVDSNWHPNVTLYKVILKGLLWINAFEGHKRTGKPIDSFLAHYRVN